MELLEAELMAAVQTTKPKGTAFQQRVLKSGSQRSNSPIRCAGQLSDNSPLYVSCMLLLQAHRHFVA